MKIEVVREKRKTLSLKVLDSENAVLKAPLFLGETKISRFLKEKENWLKKTAEKLKAIEQFSNQFQFDKFIYINGKEFAQTKELVLDFDRQAPAKKRNLIKKYYLSRFPELADLAKNISINTGMRFSQICATNSVRVWGSFNTAGRMKLNWKLLILPQRLVEYVIVHELCHGKHMNHSPKFWACVQKFCPEYKKLKKELASYGFLLKSNTI